MNWKKFEMFCLNEHARIFRHKVWSWSNIPYEHLENSGYIHNFNKNQIYKSQKKLVNEFGLDGLAYDYDKNTYHGIQCKFWKSSDYIKASDLGSFYQVLITRLQKKNLNSKGFLYFTCRLQKELKQDFFNSNAIIPIYCNKDNIF